VHPLGDGATWRGKVAARDLSRRCTRVGLRAAVAVALVASTLATPMPAAANGPRWPSAGQVITHLGRPGIDATVHPDPAPRLIALTFDDGPHPTRTPAILDILAARGVKATFFVTGDRARAYPALVRRMDAEGHVVATHTVNHPLLTSLSASQQRAQIAGGADIIDGIVGAGTARCLRPPYGGYSSTTVQVARDRGLAIVLWSRDANDWRGWSTSQMVAAALNTSRDGGRGILILHDTLSNTVGALPSIISALASNGYRFATICGDGRGAPVSLGDQRYVQATFRVFLGRSATQAELDRWGSHLYYGGPRSALTDTLARSREWVGRSVQELYQAAFQRPADPAGHEFWIGYVLAGRRITDVGAHLLASQEFFTRAGATNLGYVTALYHTVLHRDPDAAGLAHWVGLLDRGTPRLTISQSFFGSRESRLDRVDRTYHSVLGRPPETAGRDYWADQLVRIDDVRLASSLAVSHEFYSRAQIIGT
jgi:peptidoglycan-N-acetylglucosamine deacetylase